MTSADDSNELMSTQEKLEWVTPKISLMEAEDTEGKIYGSPSEGFTKGAPKGPS